MKSKIVALLIAMSSCTYAMEKNKFCLHKSPRLASTRKCPDTWPYCVKYQAVCLKGMHPYQSLNQGCVSYSKPGYPSSMVTVHTVYCPPTFEKLPK